MMTNFDLSIAIKLWQNFRKSACVKIKDMAFFNGQNQPIEGGPNRFKEHHLNGHKWRTA